MKFTYYEFFAGGGMVRTALKQLGEEWQCVFANDLSQMKSETYRKNFGAGSELCVGDVRKIESSQVSGHADLAWASFPCQDLSLAGNQAGLSGERSGTFWAFWRIIKSLEAENRAPRVIVLENVYGTVTANGGRDLAALLSALAEGGYRFGPLLIDAVHFVPQSRTRLFIVGVHAGVSIPTTLVSEQPINLWHPATLMRVKTLLSPADAQRWIWWSLPEPASREDSLAQILETEPKGVAWHSAAETERLLSLMSDVNLKKVEDAKAQCRLLVGGVYKRTRRDRGGERTQRAEVRFDDVSGCLRTPAGGSSRQVLLIVNGEQVRSRLLSPREAARLMGLPDDYRLPDRYNDAYHVAGDGVVVPVVKHVVHHICEPILRNLHSSMRNIAA